MRWKPSLPILAIPTTYAGSEMTPIYGLTEGGLKKTGRDLRVLPKTVIYDPDAHDFAAAVRLSLTSGINAIAHAAEGLVRTGRQSDRQPDGGGGHSRARRRACRASWRKPDDLEARADCLYGAWLCGAVLGSVGMALHHKLCHTLGGTFNLPHAETHTIVLPHVLAYNRDAAPDAMKRIARALHADDAAQGVFDLAREHGAPIALKEIGFTEGDLDVALALALKNPYWNPRPVEHDPLRALLESAFVGQRPV